MNKQKVTGNSACPSTGSAKKDYLTLGEISEQLKGTLIHGNSNHRIFGLSVPWSAKSTDICVVASKHDLRELRPDVVSVVTIQAYATKIHGVSNIMVVENATEASEMLMNIFTDFYKN